MEEVFGGVGGCPAGGTEVIWGPAHPHQEIVEGRAGVELGECRAVRKRMGQGGFLSAICRALSIRNTLSGR